MRILMSIILRLFLGLTTGIFFFYLGSFFLLDDGANSKMGIASAIFLPFALAIFFSWITCDIIANSRFKNKWMKIAKGEVETEEYKWQKLVMKGLRSLLSPLSIPGSGFKRAKEYSYTWALRLLQMRMKEEWCWELYEIHWEKISKQKSELLRLEQLLFESDSLTDEAFRVGLKLYNAIDEKKDLIQLLALEGFKREDNKLLPKEIDTIEEIWIRASSGDSKIINRIIPRLVKSFLAVKRRDEIAGKIYLLALKNKICPHSMKEEMYIISCLLNQLGRNDKLAAQLSRHGNKPEREIFVEDIISEDFQVDENYLEPGDKPLVDSDEQVLETFNGFDEETITDKRIESPKRANWINLIRIFSLFWNWLVYSIKQVIKISRYVYNRKKDLKPHHFIALLSVVAIIIILFITIPDRSSLSMSDNELSHPGPVLSDYPFTIQVAAYKLKKTAVQQLNKLRLKNIDAYLVNPAENKSSYYQLRFGHYNTIQEANAAADSFKTTGTIEEYFIARFEHGEVPDGIE